MIKNTGRAHQPTSGADCPDSQKRLTKHQQIALLTTLEKCTQLQRDDKAAVRRKLRELDEEVVTIFTKHKKPINYQMLQIDLRRFIAKNKQPAQSNRISSNKENMPSCSQNNRRAANSYRLPSGKSLSLAKQDFMERPEGVESKSAKASASSQSKKVENISPSSKSNRGGWFNKLQHKLKFKNQVQDQCIPVDSKESQLREEQPSITPHSQLLQPLSLTSPKGSERDEPIAPRSQRNMSTKMIKDRILDRKRKVQSIDITSRASRDDKPCLLSPQEPLMFSFKNDLRWSLHNIREEPTVNISSLDGSPIKQQNSLNETQRKIILEMEKRRSSLPRRLSADCLSPMVFRSEYEIEPQKADLLKELTIFKGRYAQDILSCFYESPRKLLSRAEFISRMKQLLQEMNVSVRSFDTLQQFITLIIGEQVFVSPVMLGNALEVIAPIKHTDARLLFNLANRRNRKVLELDDLLIYLREVIQRAQLLPRAEYLVYQLFYFCSKDGRLSYWDLYLSQQTEQFRELCMLLSQPSL